MTSQAAGAAPKDTVPSAFRFATELVAWVATPWWLSHTSWVLAALSLVVLIGLPAVFATPGDKAQVIVAVPGWATVLMVLLEVAAAVVSAWALWPVWAAACVSALAAVTLVTEDPRRRRLLTPR
ncbi:hypothetical protein [Actinacidiphila rubida]|uniref:Uncharacterized protein n=1 Tax=Actinacidiphila rubida TaxID=310780 RepID=A0A1H8KTN7_9ACTN|nr:hypothetical protein [Actinacidiphila rubida]SEN96235.1 hypothetical protein SAMN05216267_101414 [Actinacidiphila rubida]